MIFPTFFTEVDSCPHDKKTEDGKHATCDRCGKSLIREPIPIRNGKTKKKKERLRQLKKAA